MNPAASLRGSGSFRNHGCERGLSPVWLPEAARSDRWEPGLPRGRPLLSPPPPPRHPHSHCRCKRWVGRLLGYLMGATVPSLSPQLGSSLILMPSKREQVESFGGGGPTWSLDPVIKAGFLGVQGLDPGPAKRTCAGAPRGSLGRKGALCLILAMHFVCMLAVTDARAVPECARTDCNFKHVDHLHGCVGMHTGPYGVFLVAGCPATWRVTCELGFSAPHTPGLLLHTLQSLSARRSSGADHVCWG